LQEPPDVVGGERLLSNGGGLTLTFDPLKKPVIADLLEKAYIL
jgi:hypothetical protein